MTVYTFFWVIIIVLQVSPVRNSGSRFRLSQDFMKWNMELTWVIEYGAQVRAVTVVVVRGRQNP